MHRLFTAFVVVTALSFQGCMSSSLLVRVSPDGTGQARVTARVFESGIRAYDSLFPERPAQAPQLEELLPAPSAGDLQRAFGTAVRLQSTRLERAADGGVRTTVVEFDDVTRLRLAFPPVVTLPEGVWAGVPALGDAPVIRFAIKPHENGDRLLLVQLPNQQLPPDPDPQITSFADGSPEEVIFKRAIKGLALQLSVELEQPLLRTNAPARSANRATIFDLNLDKMINAMDEPRVRRLLSQGSLQEILWQVGDLPGAVVPVDHEVFLEYESQQPAAPAPAPAPQPPPDTEIYLAPLRITDGASEVGPAVNITNSPGYDNQPSFTPDGTALLFTSGRGGTAAAPQTDIYRYDLGTRAVSRVTNTPESEYSPTVMPDGTRMSVVRVEADGSQRLWSVTPSGPKIQLEVILGDVKPVGYHAWVDERTLALFVLGSAGQPATLQLADVRTGVAVTLASDIGRSIQRIPGPAGSPTHISFVQRERRGDELSLVFKELNPSTRAISVLTAAVPGSREADAAWTPDGTLLMVQNGMLYGWRRGETGWRVLASLERMSLRNVTRLAVSPKGDYLALVASPGPSR